MKFTTPCFVYVKDAEKQKTLTEWLQSIGRECLTSPSVENNCCHLVAYERPNLMWVELEGDSTVRKFEEDFYNCGENIELFKALAAMNDENDREQWFVVEHTGNADEFVFADSEDALAYIQSGDGYRKATAEEIIEHFKNERK